MKPMQKLVRLIPVIGTMAAALLFAAWSHGVFQNAAFNGGRVQVNMNFSDTNFSGAAPFINVMKGGANWTGFGGPQVPPTPADLDVNGYPVLTANLTTNVGWVTNGLVTPIEPDRTIGTGNNYCIDWTGEGVIDFGNSNYTLFPGPGAPFFYGSEHVSGTTSVAPSSINRATSTGSSTSFVHWWCITQTAGQITVHIRTTGEAGTGINPIQNLRMYWVGNCTSPQLGLGCGNYDDLAAGKIFEPRFVNVLKDAKIGILRFMNWEVNSSSLATNVSKFSQEKNQSYVFWGGATYPPPSMYLGAGTRATNDTYTATCPVGTFCNGVSGYTPADKDTVAFTADFGPNYHQITGITPGATTVVSVADASTFAAGQHVIVYGVEGFCCPGGATCNSSVTTACDFGNGKGQGTINLAIGLLTPWYWTVISVNYGANTIEINLDSSQTGIPPNSGSWQAWTGARCYAVGVYTPCQLGGSIAIKTNLSINGGPAIDFDTGVVSANPSGNPTTGAVVVAVYDALSGFWTNVATGNLESHVPPSVMIELANEVGAYPYFTTPWLTCFSNACGSDGWVVGMANLAKSTLNPGLKMVVESMNESWNGAASNHTYAYRAGAIDYGGLGGTAATYVPDCCTEFQAGAWSSEVCQDMASVYNIANLGTSYWCVQGEHANNPIPGPPDERFSSDHYIAKYHPGTGDTYRAYNWTSHLTTTTYYGACCDVEAQYAYARFNNAAMSFVTGDATAQVSAMSLAGQGYIDILTVILNNQVGLQWAPYSQGMTVTTAPNRPPPSMPNPTITLAKPMQLISYEGGNYSNTPAVMPTNFTARILGMTATNPARLTLATDLPVTACTIPTGCVLYDSMSGVVTLNVSNPNFLYPRGIINGDTFFMTGITGTGADVALLNGGPWTAVSGSGGYNAGTVLKFQWLTGKTLTGVTGGWITTHTTTDVIAGSGNITYEHRYNGVTNEQISFGSMPAGACATALNSSVPNGTQFFTVVSNAGGAGTLDFDFDNTGAVCPSSGMTTAVVNYWGTVPATVDHIAVNGGNPAQCDLFLSTGITNTIATNQSVQTSLNYDHRKGKTGYIYQYIGGGGTFDLSVEDYTVGAKWTNRGVSTAIMTSGIITKNQVLTQNVSLVHLDTGYTGMGVQGNLYLYIGVNATVDTGGGSANYTDTLTWTNLGALKLSGQAINPFGNVGNALPALATNWMYQNHPSFTAATWAGLSPGFTGAATPAIDSIGHSPEKVTLTHTNCAGITMAGGVNSGTVTIGMQAALAGVLASLSYTSALDPYTLYVYNQWTSLGGIFPSRFTLGGNSTDALTGGMFYPTIFATPSHDWNTTATFNGGTYP
jgi:hypothetical protein